MGSHVILTLKLYSSVKNKYYSLTNIIENGDIMKVTKHFIFRTDKADNAIKCIKKLRELGVYNDNTNLVEYDDEDIELGKQINDIFMNL